MGVEGLLAMGKEVAAGMGVEGLLAMGKEVAAGMGVEGILAMGKEVAAGTGVELARRSRSSESCRLTLSFRTC
jgi:hypothetical protein